MYEAMTLAASKVTGTDKHKDEVRIAVARFNKMAAAMGYGGLLIKDLRYGIFSEIFDAMKLRDHYFNKFRAYFSSVMRVLRKNECVTSNFALELDRRVTVVKPRAVLTGTQLEQVISYLLDNYPDFYRYAMIFHLSGARSTELLGLQLKHVRIQDQEYDVLIKKGKQYVWETKVILLDALPYWREIVAMASSDNDFLFSDGLRPGKEKIDYRQIPRRWRLRVKNKVGFLDGVLVPISEHPKCSRIEADFYALKHSFLDMLDARQAEAGFVDPEALKIIDSLPIDDQTKAVLIRSMAGGGFDMAQRMAAHRSVAITNKVYKVGRASRENKALKSLRLDFNK